ncbi:transcription repressor OFP8 [Gastrolobium bilobum]|uniref:transcription repressor OFP8 n=1 Tax=Gastrolobium bilobum TaxID=150636 RepID=UPI002AAFDF6C|nr:transcription repressor OFP8 [Gastrolobium bilobum]
MENQNKLKMRISRVFRSSFGSCRTRNLTDVMEKAVFAPPNHRGFHLIEPPSPKTRPFPPICRPKGSETIDDRCFVSVKDSLRRRKISEWSSPFVLGGNGNGNGNGSLNGRSCPPASPNTTFSTIHENHFGFDEKTKVSARNLRNKKKKKKKHTQKKSKAREMFPFNSCAKDTNFGGYWWYSSDDEDDETDTLFSSKSLSSDSSRSRRRHPSRRKNDRSSEMGVLPLHGKVKDTFAVVKRSSDPYNDFRTSMVEMIVEKQIFSPADLENLLQCFLSLNSDHHHKIIVEVFTEIWEALFSDWL